MRIADALQPPTGKKETETHLLFLFLGLDLRSRPRRWHVFRLSPPALGEVRGDRVCVSEMVLCGIEVVLGRQGWPSNVGRDI